MQLYYPRLPQMMNWLFQGSQHVPIHPVFFYTSKIYILSKIKLVLNSIHYKTLAAYRRLFLPLSGVLSGETTLRRFCKSPIKKCGKVAHRRFYKTPQSATNAEKRVAKSNIIFRHTGVSRNADMSIILIIDIPAFWATPVCY